MPLGRFVIAVVAAIVALLASSSAAAWSAPRPTTALGSTGGSPTVALVQDSARLSSALVSQFPSSFGGLTVSATGITVYVTQMPKGLATVVGDVVPGDAVRFARSAHTLGALEAVHRDIADNWLAYQEDEDMDIVGFGPNVAMSTEVIDVVAPTAAQVAFLDHQFPAREITVDPVGMAPIPTGFTQRVDAEPHAALPAQFGWALAALATLALCAVAAVVARARWPRRRVASEPSPVPALAPAATAPAVAAAAA